MRISGVSLGVLGDLVPGSFTVPQNPVTDAGLGDFVPGLFTVPQNPVRDAMGLSGLGCGGGCGCGGECGACRGGGMGAIDWSLTGTGILSSISPTLTVPNWAVYGAVALLGVMAAMGGGTAGLRRRR